MLRSFLLRRLSGYFPGRTKAAPPAVRPNLGSLPGSAETKLVLARSALLIEALWPRAWPLLILVLAFAGLAFFEAFSWLPGFVHGLALIAFVGAAMGALWHLVRGLKLPDREQGLARLERDAGLAHAPLRHLSDRLAAGVGDPASEDLWRVHRERAALALARLKVRPPAPDVARGDPFAVRVAAAAFALIGFLYAGGDRTARLADALSPELLPSEQSETIVDAWITAPDYTRLAPVFLRASGETFSVPVGSVLTVRVAGPKRAPSVRRLIDDPADLPADWRANLAMPEDGERAFKIEVVLDRSATYEVRGGRRRLAVWPIAVIADAPPQIAFAGAPKATEKAFLNIPLRASDDFGIAQLTAEIRLIDGASDPQGEPGELRLLDPSAPVREALNLPGAEPKTIETAELLDLTAHPWAGKTVELTLEARDAAGQTGFSQAERIKLPERIFTDPLARAVIEQRKLLAEAPLANQERVRSALDALAVAPERFSPDAATYLSLRVAYFRLGHDLTADNLKSLHDLLWSLALHIEDGDVTIAAQQLREIQEELMSALARNAPEAEIAELMARLRAALERYLSALAEHLEQQTAEGAELPAFNPDGRVLTAEDLARMMQSIEDMASTGSREAAQQMLAEMQRLLDNLRLTSPGGAMSPEEQAMSSALEGLSGIVRDQRALLDETFRRSPSGSGPSADDRPESGLARDQAELRERLERLVQSLAERAPVDTAPLGKAGEAMGEAQDRLAAGDTGEAVDYQQQALAQLEQGLSELAEALSQSLGGRSAGDPGADGRDPLGRQSGPSTSEDQSVKVPSEQRLQRARRILEELKRRASDPTRPKEELDYIDRLLKRF